MGWPAGPYRRPAHLSGFLVQSIEFCGVAGSSCSVRLAIRPQDGARKQPIMASLITTVTGFFKRVTGKEEPAPAPAPEATKPEPAVEPVA